MKDNYIYISKKLRELRQKKKVTQVEVAKALGVPVSTYNAYELGTNIPRDGMKVKIANYFGKSVAYIFFPKLPIESGNEEESMTDGRKDTDTM